MLCSVSSSSFGVLVSSLNFQDLYERLQAIGLMHFAEKGKFDSIIDRPVEAREILKIVHQSIEEYSYTYAKTIDEDTRSAIVKTFFKDSPEGFIELHASGLLE